MREHGNGDEHRDDGGYGDDLLMTTVNEEPADGNRLLRCLL